MFMMSSTTPLLPLCMLQSQRPCLRPPVCRCCWASLPLPTWPLPQNAFSPLTSWRVLHSPVKAQLKHHFYVQTSFSQPDQTDFQFGTSVFAVHSFNKTMEHFLYLIVFKSTFPALGMGVWKDILFPNKILTSVSVATTQLCHKQYISNLEVIWPVVGCILQTSGLDKLFCDSLFIRLGMG